MLRAIPPSDTAEGTDCTETSTSTTSGYSGAVPVRLRRRYRETSTDADKSADQSAPSDVSSRIDDDDDEAAKARAWHEQGCVDDQSSSFRPTAEPVGRASVQSDVAGGQMIAFAQGMPLTDFSGSAAGFGSAFVRNVDDDFLHDTTRFASIWKAIDAGLHCFVANRRVEPKHWWTLVVPPLMQRVSANKGREGVRVLILCNAQYAAAKHASVVDTKRQLQKASGPHFIGVWNSHGRRSSQRFLFNDRVNLDILVSTVDEWREARSSFRNYLNNVETIVILGVTAQLNTADIETLASASTVGESGEERPLQIVAVESCRLNMLPPALRIWEELMASDGVETHRRAVFFDVAFDAMEYAYAKKYASDDDGDSRPVWIRAYAQFSPAIFHQPSNDQQCGADQRIIICYNKFNPLADLIAQKKKSFCGIEKRDARVAASERILEDVLWLAHTLARPRVLVVSDDTLRKVNDKGHLGTLASASPSLLIHADVPAMEQLQLRFIIAVGRSTVQERAVKGEQMPSAAERKLQSFVHCRIAMIVQTSDERTLRSLPFLQSRLVVEEASLNERMGKAKDDLESRKPICPSLLMSGSCLHQGSGSPLVRHYLIDADSLLLRNRAASLVRPGDVVYVHFGSVGKHWLSARLQGIEREGQRDFSLDDWHNQLFRSPHDAVATRKARNGHGKYFAFREPGGQWMRVRVCREQQSVRFLEELDGRAMGREHYIDGDGQKLRDLPQSWRLPSPGTVNNNKCPALGCKVIIKGVGELTPLMHCIEDALELTSSAEADDIFKASPTLKFRAPVLQVIAPNYIIVKDVYWTSHLSNALRLRTSVSESLKEKIRNAR